MNILFNELKNEFRTISQIRVVPYGVHDGEAELALGQVFGEALIVGVLLQAQVREVVTNLKKWCRQC
jgi:hypothetical protein